MLSCLVVHLIRHVTVADPCHRFGPGLYPGITASTSPTDYFALKQFQMFRFSGEEWLPFGPNALARFDRDALAQPHADTVVIPKVRSCLLCLARVDVPDGDV